MKHVLLDDFLKAHPVSDDDSLDYLKYRDCMLGNVLKYINKDWKSDAERDGLETFIAIYSLNWGTSQYFVGEIKTTTPCGVKNKQQYTREQSRHNWKYGVGKYTR